MKRKRQPHYTPKRHPLRDVNFFLLGANAGVWLAILLTHLAY